MSPDERAIRDLIATWMSASAAGDDATVLSLMTDDVVFLVAGRPPFGKAEFAAAQSGLGTHRIEAQSDVREVSVAGLAGVRANAAHRHDHARRRRRAATPKRCDAQHFP